MEPGHETGGGKRAPGPHADESASETNTQQIEGNNHGYIPKTAANSAEGLRIRIGAARRN